MIYGKQNFNFLIAFIITFFFSRCNLEKNLHHLSFSKTKHHSIIDAKETDEITAVKNVAAIPVITEEASKDEVIFLSRENYKTSEYIKIKNPVYRKAEIIKIVKEVKKNIKYDYTEDGKIEPPSASLALVFGALSILMVLASMIYFTVTAFLLIGPFSILAIIFGAIARRKIRKHPEELKGISKANFALITGITLLSLWIALLTAFVIFLFFFWGIA